MGLFVCKTWDQFYLKRGVVVHEKVAAKEGPSSTLETLFFVHEGVSVFCSAGSGAFEHQHLLKN